MQTRSLHTHFQMDSAYTSAEAKFLKPWQNIRQFLLHPVTKFLIALKVTPNLLSYFSVILGIGFAVLADKNFTLAFWVLIGSIFCDALDGVLARELKIDSKKGAFTDAICDQTVLALSVIGMILNGGVTPTLGVAFVYLYTSYMMLIILHNILGVASEFLVRPGRNIFFIAIGIYYLFHINLLNYFIIASLITIPLLFVSFQRIRSAL